MSNADASAFLAEMNAVPLFRPGHWSQIGIAELQTLALLGDIGLYLAEDGQHAEIGFTLARESQGHGHATAAVREALRLIFILTTVDRVLGIVDTRNEASIRVLERVGMFRQEERSTIFRNESCTEYVYSVTRSEAQASAQLDRRR